jgi:hypothetical protein
MKTINRNLLVILSLVSVFSITNPVSAVTLNPPDSPTIVGQNYEIVCVTPSNSVAFHMASNNYVFGGIADCGSTYNFNEGVNNLVEFNLSQEPLFDQRTLATWPSSPGYIGRIKYSTLDYSTDKTVSLADFSGNEMYDNFLSGLYTAIPYLAVMFVIFWAVRFVLKRINGQTH